MIPSLIIFLTRECQRPICLDFPLYTSLNALARVAWLSQCINTFETFSLANVTSSNRSHSHSTSYPAEARATNFVSMVERVIHVCFLLFQEIVHIVNVNIHPVVDL